MKRHAGVVGLGFGDEGKGAVTDYLTGRRSPYGPGHFKTVVRFNGGAQAGHRVVRADALPMSHAGAGGGDHVFSQFGSGYFNGLMTHLSRHSLVDPLALISEAEALDRKMPGHAFKRLTVDRHALLVTPFHSAANKAREMARGVDRHGSCGMGIGETTAFSLQHPDDAPRVGDAQDKKALRRKLWGLHDFYDGLVPTSEMPPIDMLVDVYHEFANWSKIVDEHFLPTILDHENVIFEGAQGVLLDQDYGFHPYTTWSRTTFANVVDLIGDHEFERIGVTRTYSTRHGAGPFPTEIDEWASLYPDVANTLGNWQGAFRVGPLDLVLLRYAVDAVGGIDQVALTHGDVAGVQGMVCTGYEPVEPRDGSKVTKIDPPHAPDQRGYQQRLTDMLMKVTPIYDHVERVEDGVAYATGAPVTIVGTGPKASETEYRAAGAPNNGEAARTYDEAGIPVPA